MNLSDNKPIPNIIYINPLIQERRKKHCTCQNRTFTIDIDNREVVCNECGSVIDPFEVLVELSKKNEKVERYYEARRNFAIELDKWFKHNKIPMQIKHLVDEYRNCQSMNVQPICPHCRKNFDFTDIKSFCNPIFNERNKD